jgi:hypothetical protein
VFKYVKLGNLSWLLDKGEWEIWKKIIING